MATGIVTTARVTHATPAATYAHVPNRNWENDAALPERAVAEGCKDIARQLIESTQGGRGPSIVLGGGRKEFLPTTEADPQQTDKRGLRADGRLRNHRYRDVDRIEADRIENPAHRERGGDTGTPRIDRTRG